MSIRSALIQLAGSVAELKNSVPKSRNRHRELNVLFSILSDKILHLADDIAALQEACDTNMTLFESLIDMYERGHILVNPDSPANVKDFARDLFGNMRQLIAVYQSAKDGESADASDSQEST